jgi:aminocarboxymuconate-semialdehyde decarboxylase
MRMVDSHFHWYPRSLMEALCKRTGDAFPRAIPTGRGAYQVLTGNETRISGAWAQWYDLDRLIARENAQGHQADVVCSTGPISALFSSTADAGFGRALSQIWNDEMAGAQQRHAGRLWASAVVPLQDTRLAIDELERAMGPLGLVGVNIPGSIGPRGRIDAERLEPFYDRAEQLGAVLFLHPTDIQFRNLLDGHDGALFEGLGRVLDVSVAAYRLVLSGIMERHPGLKVFVSHTGGALPYQAGFLDKNSRAARLPMPPSHYLRRMFTDTVQPHAPGLRFAIDFYGVDHVMFGDDFPCWNPESALKVLDEIGLSAVDREKIMNSNARRILGLKDPLPAQPSVPAGA